MGSARISKQYADVVRQVDFSNSIEAKVRESKQYGDVTREVDFSHEIVAKTRVSKQYSDVTREVDFSHEIFAKSRIGKQYAEVVLALNQLFQTVRLVGGGTAQIASDTNIITPPSPTRGQIIMSTLGCGEWRAFLATRGGESLLAELPWAELNSNRKLDDISDSSVSLSVGEIKDECCAALNTLLPWRTELTLYRNNHLAWTGPVIDVAFTPERVDIQARDLFQWFERRYFEENIVSVDKELSKIFREYVENGLARDSSPNIIMAITSETGILASRTVQKAERKRVADELRELARTGLDWTMFGRNLLVGGESAGTTVFGPLITDNFIDPTVRIQGLQAATEVTVLGAARGSSSRTFQATVGGVSDDVGLLQLSISEPKIQDVASARAAARARLLMSNPPPPYLSGTLDPNTGFLFEELVPGMRIDIRVRVGCFDVIDTMRLTSVEAGSSVSDEGVTEGITINLVPLGQIEET